MSRQRQLPYWSVRSVGAWWYCGCLATTRYNKTTNDNKLKAGLLAGSNNPVLTDMLHLDVDVVDNDDIDRYNHISQQIRYSVCEI